MEMVMAIAGRVALRPPVPSSSLLCFHCISRRFPISVSPLRTRTRTRSCSYKAGKERETEKEKEMEMEWVSRKEGCGELKGEDIGKRVRLCGWVALHRLHASLTFFNLRDHTGIVQITTLPEEFPEAHSIAKKLRLESVVSVEGLVRSRPKEALNHKMKTGMIEVAAETIRLLNPVQSALPFLVTTADGASDIITEEVRLRYRYIDLRRQQMNNNLRLRHKVSKVIRQYLEDVHGFVEIETPILSKSTPEGARDYLVPSRIQGVSPSNSKSGSTAHLFVFLSHRKVRN